MPRYLSRPTPLLLLVALAVAGCREELTAPTVSPTDDSGAGAAPDALLAGSSAAPYAVSPHFFFLPPLVPAPQPSGTFDPSLAPTVTICALNRQRACRHTLATYTMQSGPGGQRITVSPNDQAYGVNWKTRDFSLSDQVNYRIRVSVGAVRLGFVDVDVPKTPRCSGISPRTNPFPWRAAGLCRSGSGSSRE